MANNEENWFDKPTSAPIPNKGKKAKRGFSFKKVNIKLPKINPDNKIVKVLSKVFAPVGNVMYKTTKKAQKVMHDKPLLRKIFYTIVLILLFRVGSTITTPGVHVTTKFSSQGSDTLIGILDLMGGGALKRFSIFALGISPYITASIIMQLLNSEVFPPLHRLGQSGPAGKRKINIITRVITLIFAFIQAITIIQSVGTAGGLELVPSMNHGWFKFFVLPVILISGSLFALFLGEQITNKGVGNGTSLIIFSGIAAALPSKIKNAFDQLVGSGTTGSTFIGLMDFFLYLLIFVVLIFIISYFYKAERHIPIQQTGSGMTNDVKQMSRLPIKLNPAGVMPVIFSLTISMLPLTIASFLDHQSLARHWIQDNMRMTDALGLALLVAINFLFTIVMALVTFKPNDVADNFKKNGTFIPGLRPGQETEDYLTGVIVRLGVFSAIYLSIIVAIQYIEQIVGVAPAATISGTSIIILVTVGIETIGQLKARDQTNKISKAKQRSVVTTEGSTTGGLLW